MDCIKVKDFQSDRDLVKTITNNFGAVLVFIFYANWNQSSKIFLKQINNSIPVFGLYENVKYISVSAQRCLQTFKKFEVEKTPTIIFTQTDYKILQRLDGNDIRPVFDSLEKIATIAKTQFEKDILIWHAKVRNMVKSSPIFLFIKGTPENPKCELTTDLVQFVKASKFEYKYFDVSADENMRNWIKHYTGETIFPIIFVDGNCIGGIKKFKQQINKDELTNAMNKNTPYELQDKLKKLLNENQTILFIQQYPFENKECEKALQQAKKKYGEIIQIYKLGMDKQLKEYILKKVKRIPFVVHNKNIVQ